MIRQIVFPIILSVFVVGCNATREKTTITIDQAISQAPDTLTLIHFETDTLFRGNQSIHIMVLPKSALQHYQLGMAYSSGPLEKTSWFGRQSQALTAVNGGFFDMDKGGSVTYLEIEDSVIHYTQPRGVDSLRWAFPDSLINGAVILTKDNHLEISPVRPESYYENSTQEAAVLVVGPLLLQNGEKYPLPNSKFVTNRHPRSYLATTPNAILFVVVDGRSESANGMTLHEAQQFLLSLGCIDAINLDGGGSTTLWTKTGGVVNHPSDGAGERSVANALVVIANP